MLLILFNPKIGPLSGATTPAQSGPGSNGNEGVLRIPQTLVGGGSYPFPEKQPMYSTASADWARLFWESVSISRMITWKTNPALFVLSSYSVRHILEKHKISY